MGLSEPRVLRLSQKKSSVRALRAHNVRTYTSGTSCAGTRRAPFVGCSSSGSPNMGDGSGGDEGGEERRPLHSGGSPTKGTKSELAASPLRSRGLNKWVEMLHKSCILGAPGGRDNGPYTDSFLHRCHFHGGGGGGLEGAGGLQTPTYMV